jgi:hypothetical protein
MLSMVEAGNWETSVRSTDCSPSIDVRHAGCCAPIWLAEALDAETGVLEVAAKQCSAGLSFVPSACWAELVLMTSACWAELVLMTSACCADLSVLVSPASRACVLMVVGITPWMVAAPGAPTLDWSGTNPLAKRGEVGQICLSSTSAQHEW